jgi:hypothetical protein
VIGPWTSPQFAGLCAIVLVGWGVWMALAIVNGVIASPFDDEGGE